MCASSIRAGTTAGQTAGDAAAWILTLIGEHAGGGSKVLTLVILDECSAVAGCTVAAATCLAERTRSAGIALVFGAQSLASRGEHAERLMANDGTTIIHRVPLPQTLLELAGTTAIWEDPHQIGASGLRIASGGRRPAAADLPDPTRPCSRTPSRPGGDGATEACSALSCHVELETVSR